MAQGSIITKAMQDSIGVDSPPITYDIEKGAIIKFAQAIGDSNPLFNDEATARQTRYGSLIAPPTFFRSLLTGPPHLEVRGPCPAGLDGGSEWEYLEPIRPGDRIAAITRILDLTERKGRLGNMLFTIRETRYVNQFDRIVATQKNTGIGYYPEN